MLINLVGTVDNNGVINFENLPCVYFTPNHTVHVSELSIKWKQSMGRSFGQLNSTLIDSGNNNHNDSLAIKNWPTDILYNFSSVYISMVTICGIYLNSKALISLRDITKVSKNGMT